jgi:hypothetical protein
VLGLSLFAFELSGWSFRVPVMRRAACAAAVLACVSSLLSSAAAAPAAGTAAGQKITAEYSGTLDEGYVYDPKNPATEQETFQLVFDESESATLQQAGPAIPDKQSLKISISGHIDVSYAPPNSSGSCSATFSLRPGAPDPFVFTNESVQASMPDNGEYVLSSSQAPNCSVEINSGIGVGGEQFPGKSVLEFTKVLSVSCGFVPGCTQHYSVDGKNAQNDSSLRATYVVHSGPATGGSGAVPTPARLRAKLAGLDALRSSLQDAVYPCLVAAGGAGLLALPPGILPGAVITGVALPLCVAWTKTIQSEATIAADPPRHDYTRLARVVVTPLRGAPPACTTSATRQLCLRLVSAANTYLRAVRTVEADASALATTVARDAGASKAGDRAAVSAQERLVQQLLARLDAGEKARATAGAQLVAALRASKVTSLMLTTAQAQAGLGALTQRLAALGLSQSKLSSLAAGALAPHSLDALVRLGS